MTARRAKRCPGAVHLASSNPEVDGCLECGEPVPKLGEMRRTAVRATGETPWERARRVGLARGGYVSRVSPESSSEPGTGFEVSERDAAIIREAAQRYERARGPRAPERAAYPAPPAPTANEEPGIDQWEDFDE